MSKREYGQFCGLARALELVGERWTLLIVRDLLVGPRRYTDLRRGLPRIPTNILAARLKELEAAELIHRRAVVVPDRSIVYELTERGASLRDTLTELSRWGAQALGDPRDGEIVTADSLTMALRTTFRPDAAQNEAAQNGAAQNGAAQNEAAQNEAAQNEAAQNGAAQNGAAQSADVQYELRMGEIVLCIDVHDGTLQIRPGPSEHPDLRIEAGPAIRALMAGEISPDEAIAAGAVRLSGDAALLTRFAATFRI